LATIELKTDRGFKTLKLEFTGPKERHRWEMGFLVSGLTQGADNKRVKRPNMKYIYSISIFNFADESKIENIKALMINAENITINLQGLTEPFILGEKGSLSYFHDQKSKKIVIVNFDKFNRLDAILGKVSEYENVIADLEKYGYNETQSYRFMSRPRNKVRYSFNRRNVNVSTLDVFKLAGTIDPHLVEATVDNDRKEITFVAASSEKMMQRAIEAGKSYPGQLPSDSSAVINPGDETWASWCFGLSVSGMNDTSVDEGILFQWTFFDVQYVRFDTLYNTPSDQREQVQMLMSAFHKTSKKALELPFPSSKMHSGLVPQPELDQVTSVNQRALPLSVPLKRYLL